MECIVLFGVVVMATVSFVILAPLRKLVREQHVRMKFALIDVFALVFELQVLMGLLFASIDQYLPFSVRIIAAILAAIIAGAIWLAGVILLSRLNLHSSWRRFLFLVYVMPVSVFGSLGCFIAFLVVMDLTGSSSVLALFVMCSLFVAIIHVAVYVRQLAKRVSLDAAHESTMPQSSSKITDEGDA